jgi:hypothetical protein
VNPDAHDSLASHIIWITVDLYCGLAGTLAGDLAPLDIEIAGFSGISGFAAGNIKGTSQQGTVGTQLVADEHMAPTAEAVSQVD